MQSGFLSPCFHEQNYGGVQYTARMAFEALGRTSDFREREVVCYGPQCRRNGSDSRACSHSKPGAILSALKLRGGAERLLFWHLDLLKLLPFAGPRDRRVFLFLHGIECWRKIGGFERRLLNRVDVFLSNSDFTWKRFIEMNPQCRARTHRTVWLGAGSPATRIESPATTPAAVIVGRMNKAERYKGHSELIHAWPLVIERIPAAELWVIGGGDGTDDLKRLASAGGVGKHVRFFGVVPDEEKERLLQRSRCLVLPSRGEGFGLVYLEAMRIGRPCLSSTHDAGQEVIHPPEAGIAVDPADIGCLAGAVAELLTPGVEWERRSADARRMYEEKFTAAHFQGRLLDALAG